MNRKTLIAECDSLWSKCIVNRDGMCFWCKSGRPLSAHHIIKRRFLSVRWDMDNGIALCPACHRWFEDNPRDAEIYLGNMDLRDKSRKVVKRTVPELQDLRKELKDTLEKEGTRNE